MLPSYLSYFSLLCFSLSLLIMLNELWKLHTGRHTEGGNEQKVQLPLKVFLR